MTFPLLDESYPIQQKDIAFYKKNNYIKLKNVLDKDCVKHFNQIISTQVSELLAEQKPLNERDTYGKAFIQKMNLWVQNEEIKKLIFSKRIAKIASNLMQTEGVRLYHDQALFKEAGGGITPWHADQFYWPLSTDRCITAWIPLQATPLEMGPLEFSAGSQQITEGRELSISDESENRISDNLRVTDFDHVIETFEIGEISFHSGWVFHRAGANNTKQTRKVITIIYMDKNMKLKEPENENQLNDWNTWCPNAKIGEIINSPINPILFP